MRKILIAVDLQNDFISGSLGTDDAISIVPTSVKKILSHNGFIIATLDTHFDNYSDTLEGKNLPVVHCIRSSHGWQLNSEIEKALRSHGNYEILEKISFGSPELPSLVEKASGGEEFEIELIGLCTDICVVSNALILKAAFPEVNITVDASCCAGVSAETHNAALQTMKMCQINIINEKN